MQQGVEPFRSETLPSCIILGCRTKKPHPFYHDRQERLSRIKQYRKEHSSQVPDLPNRNWSHFSLLLQFFIFINRAYWLSLHLKLSQVVALYSEFMHAKSWGTTNQIIMSSFELSWYRVSVKSHDSKTQDVMQYILKWDTLSVQHTGGMSERALTLTHHYFYYLYHIS